MYFLFDIGGTNMRFSLGQEGDLVGEPLIVDTPQNYQLALQLIKESSEKLKQNNLIEKVAGGIAGVFNQDKSYLTNSPNLPDWNNKPIKKDLGDIFGIEPILKNDADLAGLGEAVYGEGKDYQIVAYLSIGTGIGGTRIVNKRIDANVSGFEPGHHFLDFDGSFSGEISDFEDLVSGSAIEKRYHVNHPSQIQEENVWDEITSIIAYGIHNVIVFWSPDIVIIGGGVAQSLPIEKVSHKLKEISTTFSALPDIKKSELGDKSGLFGALNCIK